MDQPRYTVVFAKLSDETNDKSWDDETFRVSVALRDEVDDIAELRRVVREIVEPEPQFYTTT